MSSEAHSWFVRFKANPTARLRLFCFPHAGGGAAAYRPWANGLSDQVEVWAVKLPGREDRLGEAPYDRLSQIVPVAARALSAYLDRPFAFFGHSMGALVCFELARELRREHQPNPLRLFVSALPAPQEHPVHPPTHHLPDPAFISEVRRRWDGVPDAVLREPELLQLLLPTLRADLAVVETYTYTPEPPLTCDISCFGGQDDRSARVEELGAWRDQTQGAFRLRVLPGGHFFLQSARDLVWRAIARDLGPTRCQVH